MADNSDSDDFSEARAEVLAFVKKHEMEPEHVHHVCKLALQIFDSLQPRHNLDARAKFALEAASLMHDVGWSKATGGKEHHKRSYEMILAHPWKMIAPDDVLIIALVARYHRKSLPSPEHDGFADLDKRPRETVCKLASLLRVADALDRSHRRKVSDAVVKDLHRHVQIMLGPETYCQSEHEAVDKKKDLFEKTYGVELLCLPH